MAGLGENERSGESAWVASSSRTPHPLAQLMLSTTADPAVLKHLRYSAADVRGLVEGGDFFVLRDDDRGGFGGSGAVVAGPA